ncbi:MAG: hypothetical protein ACYTDT_12615 [Planctomycetota bacterium]|jgi:hypothetical protein
MAEKQRVEWWKLWPIAILALFVGEMVYSTQKNDLPMDWKFVGICAAAAVLIFWMRIGRRI